MGALGRRTTEDDDEGDDEDEDVDDEQGGWAKGSTVLVVLTRLLLSLRFAHPSYGCRLRRVQASRPPQHLCARGCSERHEGCPSCLMTSRCEQRLA